MRSKRLLTGLMGGITAVIILIFFLQFMVSRLWAGGSGGQFYDSGQMLGGDISYAAVLADVDGDTDLDVITANSVNNTVRLNDGYGYFNAGSQVVGGQDSRGVAAGPLDNNNSVDLFFANYDADNGVWVNDGSGNFSPHVQTMNPTAVSLDVALGNLDGDLDLDAFVANDGPNEVWLNDATAVFSLTQTVGGDDTSHKVVLGDVDGDDDLDAYVANGSASAEMDELWLNDGSAVFTPTTQMLSTDWNEGAALADLDGDDDLDLFLANWFGSDSVWLNDGSGTFTPTNQVLSGSGSLDVALADVDGDDDLDAIVAKNVPDADELWLNDGSGQFSLSSQLLDTTTTYATAVGLINEDDDPDLFFANFGANTVWFAGACATEACFNVDARFNSAGQRVYPWAQAADAVLPILLNFTPAQTTNILARVESATTVYTETIPFPANVTTGELTVANPNPDPSEAMTLTLSLETLNALAPGGLFNPLNLVFVDQQAGHGQPCSGALCYLDWLLKLLGFDTSFWMLHHLELNELQQSEAWPFYQNAFSTHNDALTNVIATHPLVLWQTFDALESWTDPLYQYDQGDGNVLVTQAMADEATVALEGIRDAAQDSHPALAAAIQAELDVLDPPGMAGMPMAEVMAQVAGRIDGRVYLPLMVKANNPVPMDRHNLFR